MQALQHTTKASEGHVSPLLNLLLCHLGGLAFAPIVLCSEAQPATYPPWQLRSSAFFFSFLLMGYNYAWLCSAKYLFVDLTNAVFQTSTALVYVASIWLFSEPVTSLRILGVGLCLGGTTLASMSNEASQAGVDGGSLAHLTLGIFLASMAAVGVTFYQVLFRYFHGHLKYDIRFLMEFGMWVSIFHIVAILPLVLLADYVGVEKLSFPVGGIARLGVAASAVIASTVNALYLCIVMWGTPMLLPCASAFSLPLTVFLDVLLHGARPSGAELLGHAMVVIAVPLILNLFKKEDKAAEVEEKLVNPASSLLARNTRRPTAYAEDGI